MSLYDVAYVMWPVLLALLVGLPSVLLFANRRAWKNGYGEGFNEGHEAAVGDHWTEQAVDLGERLHGYGSTACTCTTSATCPLHGDEAVAEAEEIKQRWQAAYGEATPIRRVYTNSPDQPEQGTSYTRP